MTIHFAASTNGFYDSDFNTSIPKDAVEITAEDRSRCLNGITGDLIIGSDDKGYPTLVPKPQSSNEELDRVARLKRDGLLKNSDYLMMADYPITPECLTEIKAYRQLLRNITNQPDYPETIIWPVLPVIVKIS